MLRTARLTLAAVALLLPNLAGAHMVAEEAVARIVSPGATTGAVYLTLRNHSDDDDRMFRVEGDIAERIEIHSTTTDDAGVMRMREMEDGLHIASGATHVMRPGAEHIMLMGLTEPLEQGDTFELLLFFDVYIPFSVTVTVDNDAANALAEQMSGEMEMEDGMEHGTNDMEHGSDG